MLVTLPNGFIEGMDHFDIAEIDELRGKQQNYLADKDLVIGNIGHIPKILEDVVLSLQTKEGTTWKGSMKDAISRLPSNDIETLLIRIRENTFGARFYHEAQCPFCQTINKNLRLDLDGLAIDKLPTAELITKKVVTLPKMQVEVEFKPLFLKDLFEVIKISKSKQHSLITCLMTLSIARIGDKSKISPEDIDNISSSDIFFLNKELEKAKIEGTIDTTIELDCSECGKGFSVKLNCMDASFFDPTKGSIS